MARTTEGAEQTKDAIVRVLKHRPAGTIGYVARSVGRSKSTVWAALKQMEAAGELVRTECSVCKAPMWEIR